MKQLHPLGLLALAALLGAGLLGCGNTRPAAPGPESDPLVPGYSAAGINIGADYSAVKALYGEPEYTQAQEGYLTIFYQPTGRYDALVPGDERPAAWHLVFILNDEPRDGIADDGDTVASIEVAEPYLGKTAGGVGLGSDRPAMEEEFGPPEQATVLETENPDAVITTCFYPARGADFLVEENGGVIMVVITARGGLKPQVISPDTTPSNPGGLAGPSFSAPVVPGAQLAGISMGAYYPQVKSLYGSPDAQGSADGYVTAAYTGGSGNWKLYVYFEDLEKDGKLGDYDTVISINVTAPYTGKTAKGNGIGSKQASVDKEFGTPLLKYSNFRLGTEMQVWEYTTQGIVFAFDAATGAVVEIDVNRIP